LAGAPEIHDVTNLAAAFDKRSRVSEDEFFAVFLDRFPRDQPIVAKNAVSALVVSHERTSKTQQIDVVLASAACGGIHMFTDAGVAKIRFCEPADGYAFMNRFAEFLEARRCAPFVAGVALERRLRCAVAAASGDPLPFEMDASEAYRSTTTTGLIAPLLQQRRLTAADGGGGSGGCATATTTTAEPPRTLAEIGDRGDDLMLFGDGDGDEGDVADERREVIARKIAKSNVKRPAPEDLLSEAPPASSQSGVAPAASAVETKKEEEDAIRDVFSDAEACASLDFAHCCSSPIVESATFATPAKARAQQPPPAAVSPSSSSSSSSLPLVAERPRKKFKRFGNKQDAPID
jgi:hypothetical protein